MRVVITGQDTFSQCMDIKPDYWAYFYSPHAKLPTQFEEFVCAHKSSYCFNDIDDLEDIVDADKRALLKAVTQQQIHSLIADIEGWICANETTNICLLFSCYAGISRSPAASFIALCMWLSHIPEKTIAHYMREKNSYITPNKAMCHYADVLLERNGRLLQAAQDIGRGKEAYSGGLTCLDTADLFS